MINSNIKNDFPIFSKKILEKDLIYFDTAASAQKPELVTKEISDFYSNHYSNVSRGVHTLSVESTFKYEDARKKVKNFINAKSENEIIFTKSATESINLVAESWGFYNLKKGDVILLTDMEHHSNIIPWQIICKKTGAEIRYLKSTKHGTINLDDLKNALNNNVKIVSITHASNVFGTINPIKEIIDIVKKNGSKIMIDGCQSIPHMKINVQDLDCDFYAFSGHKMFGPTGVGVLYGKEEILEKMHPYQTGGGIIETVSMTDSTWTTIPHRFEPGSPMAAQVIGLSEAVNYLEKCLDNHDNSLNEYSLEKMKSINGISIYGQAAERTPIISFNIDGIHSLDLAHFLDFEGITIRSGHHCCQPLMSALDISSCARASFYFYNNNDEVDFLVEKINKAIPILK